MQPGWPAVCWHWEPLLLHLQSLQSTSRGRGGGLLGGGLLWADCSGSEGRPGGCSRAGQQCVEIEELAGRTLHVEQAMSREQVMGGRQTGRWVAGRIPNSYNGQVHAQVPHKRPLHAEQAQFLEGIGGRQTACPQVGGPVGGWVVGPARKS